MLLKFDTNPPFWYNAGTERGIFHMTAGQMFKKIKRSKAYKFLYYHFKSASLILAVLVWLCVLMMTSNNYDDFLESLALRESSGDYDVVNQFGYLGRYQLGGMALQDAGFLDEAGNWTELANSHGVYSEEDFLGNPKAQEKAIRTYHTKLCSYIKSYGLDEYLGKQYCGVKITQSGLLAACHLVGVKAMSRALATGEIVCDGNGVPASEYLELFSGYRISEVWN